MCDLITAESPSSEKRCGQFFSSWYSGYSFVGVCSCDLSESSLWCTPTTPRLMVIVAASPPIATRSCCCSSPSKIVAVSSSVRPIICFVCCPTPQKGHPGRTFGLDNVGNNKNQLNNKPPTISYIIPPSDGFNCPRVNELIEDRRKHDCQVL